MGVSSEQPFKALDLLYNRGTGSGQNGYFQLLSLLKEARFLLLLDGVELGSRNARHRNA